MIRVIHRPDGETNEVRVMHRRNGDDAFDGSGEPIEFIAVIVSTDDPSDDAPWAWQRASTLEGIYGLIAQASLNAPLPSGFRVWNAPELEEFQQAILGSGHGPA